MRCARSCAAVMAITRMVRPTGVAMLNASTVRSARLLLQATKATLYPARFPPSLSQPQLSELCTGSGGGVGLDGSADVPGSDDLERLRRALSPGPFHILRLAYR
jgi:hypothetical protein